MDKKGPKLNEKVWRLFEKAGFTTDPNSNSTSEHSVDLGSGKKRPVDLFATSLGVTIIGENKSGRNKEGSWTAFIADLANKKKRAKADACLLIITGREISPEDKDHADQEKIQLWGERELSYYGAVADAIGDYAKYEILHALKLKTKEEKDIHRVLALRLRQPFSDSSTELFLFSLPPEILLKTCVIYRRAQGNAQAYQRMLNKSRLPKIEKFVTREGALLPTNIIVHLHEKVHVDPVPTSGLLKDEHGRPITLTNETAYDWVVLSLPKEYASLELIDGQHRLYGFAKTEPGTKQKFNLVVLGIKNVIEKQRQEMFVGINDNSRRMDPNLVAYLKYTDNDNLCQKDNELMAIRVAVDLNGFPPLKNKIKLLDVGNQKISLRTLSGYDLKGLLGSKGLLRKHYPGNSPKEYTRVLKMYFSTIEEVFEKEWHDPEKYIIGANRGVSAFLKLLRSILKTDDGPIEYKGVVKYLKALKANWTQGWKSKELKQSYTASQGWKKFHRDMIAAIRQQIPEFKE